MELDARYLLKISSELKDKATKKAEEEGYSLADFIRIAIKEKIEKDK